MTPQEAKIFGRTKALKATGLMVTISVAAFIFLATRNDFANGLLFFMEAISNIHLLAVLAILFSLTFLFGGIAGKEVILCKKGIILISLKYSILIVLTIIIYAAIIGIVKGEATISDNFRTLITTYLLTPLTKVGAIMIVPLLMIWLWATYQMRLRTTNIIE